MTLSIAYLCDQSPLDPGLYSGGNSRMYQALRQHAGQVTILQNGWHAAQPVRRMIERMPDAIHMRLRWRAHLALGQLIARGVAGELAAGQFDAVFCPYSIWSLHRVSVPPGMVSCFTSDTTQSVFQNSDVGTQHNGRLRISRPLDAWVERCERGVLHAADLVLWPSRWQAQSAADRYGLPADKTHLVPWGANLDWVDARAPHMLTKGGALRLLLIGRDWFAKGGPVAFATMQALRARGIDASLTVIGCTPPDTQRDAHVTVLGRLDKANPAEFAIMQNALQQAHFLMQPSYESYGFAFCEASAYGLPSLCLNIGGVPVEDGVNGHALPPGSDAQAFADQIDCYVRDPRAYQALSRSTRHAYETRLNWDAWGRRVGGLLEQAVAAKRGG